MSPDDRMSCVFCAIIAGQAEASLVHADDTVLAFMDIRPANPGHILVVPREHSASLAELTESVGAQVWRVGQRIARALRHSGLRADGVNLWLADGVAAGQEVFHIHLHVVPRYHGDGFRLEIDWQNPHRAELDTNAALVGRALSDSLAAPSAEGAA